MPKRREIRAFDMSTDLSRADLGLYTNSFFDGFSDVSYGAAKVLLSELYGFHRFSSVCDIGCGSGTWLRAAAEMIQTGERRLTGIDGEHARSVSKCDGAEFVFQDLEQRIVGVAKHDLAISLEVAEHLSPARSESFVADLCKVSDVVFFGAAVDGQGGVNHINEQPQSYWVKRFAENGYQPFIFHRTKFWNDPIFELCPYYISGSFLYVKDEDPLFRKIEKWRAKEDEILDVVHPNILKWQKEECIPFPVQMKRTVRSFFRALKRRL